MGRGYALFILFLFFSPIAHADWRDDFLTYLQEELIAPEAASLEQPASLEIVLVSGFLSDLLPGTFQSAQDVLGSGAILWTPSSLHSIEASADEIADRIRLRRATNQSTTDVFVGHSRGSVVLWVAAMKYPELFRDQDKVILMQGAFGGSHLATAVAYAGKGLKALPNSDSTWLSYAHEGLGFLTTTFSAQLSSKLTPESATKVVEMIARRYGKKFPTAQRSKLLFLATHESHPADWTSYLCGMALAMVGMGLNDGVLSRTDQYPGWARPEEIRELEGVDHLGFSGGEPGRALARALIRLVRSL